MYPAYRHTATRQESAAVAARVDFQSAAMGEQEKSDFIAKARHSANLDSAGKDYLQQYAKNNKPHLDGRKSTGWQDSGLHGKCPCCGRCRCCDGPGYQFPWHPNYPNAPWWQGPVMPWSNGQSPVIC